MTELFEKLRATLAKDWVRLTRRTSQFPLQRQNRHSDTFVAQKKQDAALTEAPQEIISDDRRNNTPFKWLFTILSASVGVTALLVGVRELKLLQSVELKAYDQMLRLRSLEATDSRLVLVSVTEDDVRTQKWPLSDSKINQLLAKLQSYQPRIIGVNLYRSEQENFASGLKDRDNIISVCAFSSVGTQEIAPPPNLSINNVGFTDLLTDDDGIVRRSLLFAHSEDQKCTTAASFATVLAMSYLEKEGIKPDYPNQKNMILSQTKNHKLKAIFTSLTSDAGGYKRIDAGGYQIMLNYRHPDRLAPEVTLTQVLNGAFNPKLVKDRLVIIGTKTPSLHPGFYTPYSALPDQPARMSPALIHAQTTSQLISAALDGRPLIWYFPEWAEVVWIWIWSLVGAALAWRLRHPLLLIVVGGTTVISLIVICTSVFLQAGWIPVVPPAIAFVTSGVAIVIYITYQTQQQTKIILIQVEKQKEAIEQLHTLLKETTEIKDKHIHTPKVEPLEKASGDSILSGRYNVTKVLGSGGFGCTYLARDMQRPGNPVCVVKQLMPARRDPKFLQVARRLFDAEAEILEVLGQHYQIPQLLAYFEDNHEFYLVQEYIQGHSLSDELPPVRGVQNESYVMTLLKEILEILVFVHDHRVIHRDIKPNNILRRSFDNRLVLIDFGAVKMMQPSSSEQTELATVAIGTRGYAPPEQFAGHPRLCSDIYAVGMIGIQAVTGLLPQELQPNPDTGSVMWRHRAQVSENLAAILDKMVRYHFSDRYQSAAEVLLDFKF
ncbi:CHASE2 domain-containing serine/threonine-protein kinase [Scytonema hofmannii]|uniref:CHASE2 domain-containing serine/threonine-protein kinase n=1 Tax=Scytonema hofmannii TaxID=34078 RepID=UPI00034B9A8D|nr:CHASE2 domain-containing serine/threonine-protein kinase [Scytonema hofmannii]